jgi:guanylate kinase
MRPARLTVLAGPSGVGKGTVVKELRAQHPEVWLSISATTRKPRPGERHGTHYWFVSDNDFDAMVNNGDLLEYAEFARHKYGTPRQPVAEHLDAGDPVLLEIDLQGARLVREVMPEALFVLLKPPSLDELRHRLEGRGTEDEASLARRLGIAEAELAEADFFDNDIVNDDLQGAVAQLVSLMGLGSGHSGHADEPLN